MNIILKDNNDDLNIGIEGGYAVKVYETLIKNN